MLGYRAHNTIHLRTPCHASIPYFQRRIEKIPLPISLNTRRATFSVTAATILFHPGDFMHDLHNLISGRGLVALETLFDRCIRRTIDLQCLPCLDEKKKIVLNLILSASRLFSSLLRCDLRIRETGLYNANAR